MATTNKISCNTSIDAQLIIDARELKLSPSAILEEALGKAVRGAKYQRWCQENKQAIEDHNSVVMKQGTFSERIKQL
jgi:antitoxin CcdA